MRGSNNYGPRQYPEKLIPLMVLNALHGDSLPVYGDGRQVRNWLYVEDFCRGIHTVLTKGQAGEAYNVGGPDECENIEVVKRVIELTGADESLIEYVNDRPGHDRRYSLSSDKLREELGWEAQVHFAEGLERTVAVVPRQRGLVGADPLRRVPRVLREAVRQGARLMPQRLPTKLDGVVLLEPEVHGDERGFMVETYRRDAWAELGVEVEFVQHNHSRSSQGTLRGIHFQTEPGQAKLVRCPRGRDLRRRRRPAPRLAHLRPVGGATCSTTRRTASSSSRSASATASPCSARSPTSPTCSPASTTRDRGRHRLGRPRRRRRVAGRRPAAQRARQERPELAEVADDPPVLTRGAATSLHRPDQLGQLQSTFRASGLAAVSEADAEFGADARRRPRR